MSSISAAIHHIREKNPLIGRLFESGGNFTKGVYHKKLGRYLKERQSILISTSSGALGTGYAFATGKTELFEPSLLYSSASILANAVGILTDHFSSEYCMKLYDELERITGKIFEKEMEIKARNEVGRYSPNKLIPYHAISLTCSGVVPILGFIAGTIHGVATANNIIAARRIKKRIFYEETKRKESKE